MTRLHGACGSTFFSHRGAHTSRNRLYHEAAYRSLCQGFRVVLALAIPRGA